MHLGKLIRTAALAAAASVAALAVPSAAQASCPAVPVSQPFAQFGDKAHYTLVPGGGFEAGMPSWGLHNSSVVDGNETYFLRSPLDVGSLRINAKGVAVSPEFCVDADYPTLRFVARSVTDTNSELVVRIVYRNRPGSTAYLTAGSIRHNGRTYATWTPSESLRLATALRVSSGSVMVRLHFVADSRGGWAIDDVYADPYRVG